MTNIIKAPIASEKAASLKEKKNTYLFRVDPKANKVQIALAVKEFFGVTPILIRTAVIKGKKRPQNKWRKVTYGPNWKKAFITLKKGESIKELE
ncbi:MAG: 50S ribosomal protein L23 [bacterium]